MQRPFIYFFVVLVLLKIAHNGLWLGDSGGDRNTNFQSNTLVLHFTNALLSVVIFLYL